MKRLYGEFDRLRRWLLKWAEAGVWLASAALAAVALLGWIDPFGLRQRIDWIVADQFLKLRKAPPIHRDLLVVAIDDGSVEQFGFPLPRSTLAGAVRQIRRLEGHTVLVDILLTEPQRKPVLEEAERWLLPAGSVISGAELGDRLAELKQRFTEDQVLARALRPAGFVVIPFSFLSHETVGRSRGAMGSSDELLLGRMADALFGEPGLGPDSMAARLGVSDELVRPLFAPALELAMMRLARRYLEQSGPESPDSAVAAILPAEFGESYVGIALRRALDRVGAELLVIQHSSVPAERARPERPRVLTEELKPPRRVFTEAAAAVGYADIPLDGDGTLRRIALSLQWNQRLVFHQALVAALVHRGARMSELEFSRGLIRHGTGDLHIAVDSCTNLTINWPMDRMHRWSDVIPMVSLKDICELDRYESDLSLLRHHRREYFKEMAKLADGRAIWDEAFGRILAAQRLGESDEAAALERTFDSETLATIQQLPAVAEALEQARTTGRPAPGDASESGIVQYARAIHDFDLQISEMEPEYLAAFRGLQEYVRGKLCLIGDTTTGSTDLRQTPPDAAMPGVAVIAAAVSTMLSNRFLSVHGYASSVLLLLVLGGALVRPFLRLGAGLAGSCAVAGMGVVFFGSYALLASLAIFISPVTPLTGLTAVYLTTTTYQWLKELRERRLVRTIFEAQTNPTIVQRLIEAGHAGVEEVLVPRTRQVTVFFAEIADYDELAGTIAPERLPELLSHTFGTMAKIVLAHEGTLDRYQGHAMVAFFGAPVYQPDHASRACRAALECCDTLRVMETVWRQRGLPVPRVHAGIHTGELLVGNITLTSRVDYTVAGENLNVAYRIGELNEIYGTQIMMSEATLARCENVAEARELDLVRIKGRREPIRAYELMSAKDRLTDEQLQLRGTFNTGLIAFRNRDYAGALAMFRSCRATSPGDRPATVYIERCERELSAPTGSVTARS